MVKNKSKLIVKFDKSGKIKNIKSLIKGKEFIRKLFGREALELIVELPKKNKVLIGHGFYWGAMHLTLQKTMHEYYYEFTSVVGMSKFERIKTPLASTYVVK